jgi:hypothetical protein
MTFRNRWRLDPSWLLVIFYPIKTWISWSFRELAVEERSFKGFFYQLAKTLSVQFWGLIGMALISAILAIILDASIFVFQGKTLFGTTNPLLEIKMAILSGVGTVTVWTAIWVLMYTFSLFWDWDDKAEIFRCIISTLFWSVLCVFLLYATGYSPFQ